MHRINVSSVHLCQRCPRLLAYECRGEKNAWRVGLTGSGSFPGKLFHDEIAAPFHLAIANDPLAPASRAVFEALAAPPGRFAMALLALLEAQVFLPMVRRHAGDLDSEQLLHLGRGFERWVHRLARFVEPTARGHDGDARERISRAFHDPERSIKAVYRLATGQAVEVSGKYDALLFDVEVNEALLMEFKGRKASHPDEDFLQLVLYSWLVREATGVTPAGIVLYLEEEEPEVFYPVDAIESAIPNLSELFKHVIDVIEAVGQPGKTPLPHTANPGLCEICKYDPRCERDWGRRSPRPPANPHDEVREEADERMRALVDTLASLKLAVTPSGYIAGPRFIRLKITPLLEHGVTVKKLCNQAMDLQVALHLNAPPLIQPQAGYVSVDVPRRMRVPLTLGEVWRQGQRNRPASVVAFPIGMAIDGSIGWADLSDPGMTSILVGGTAGSGKSMFLRAAAVGLALGGRPGELEVTLIDPKRVSFTDLTHLRCLAGPVVMDYPIAMERLKDLVDEMEARYRLFEKHRVPDVETYKAHGEHLSHHVILIDEYADLMIDGRARVTLEALLVRLAQKGRAAGIHLIVATQRPDVKVVTPLIKANLQLKVALKVTTASNSKVILDEIGAECLIGNGDMLIGGSVPIQRLQAPLVSKTDIDAAAVNTRHR